MVDSYFGHRGVGWVRHHVIDVQVDWFRLAEASTMQQERGENTAVIKTLADLEPLGDELLEAVVWEGRCVDRLDTWGPLCAHPVPGLRRPCVTGPQVP